MKAASIRSESLIDPRVAPAESDGPCVELAKLESRTEVRDMFSRIQKSKGFTFEAFYKAYVGDRKKT